MRSQIALFTALRLDRDERVRTEAGDDWHPYEVPVSPKDRDPCYYCGKGNTDRWARMSSGFCTLEYHAHQRCLPQRRPT